MSVTVYDDRERNQMVPLCMWTERVLRSPSHADRKKLCWVEYYNFFFQLWIRLVKKNLVSSNQDGMIASHVWRFKITNVWNNFSLIRLKSFLFAWKRKDLDCWKTRNDVVFVRVEKYIWFLMSLWKWKRGILRGWTAAITRLRLYRHFDSHSTFLDIINQSHVIDFFYSWHCKDDCDYYYYHCSHDYDYYDWYFCCFYICNYYHYY